MNTYLTEQALAASTQEMGEAEVLEMVRWLRKAKPNHPRGFG